MAIPHPVRLFNHATAPSPRRIRMALAEKEISVEVVDVDIQNAENLTDEFRQKNPMAKVPVLELSDGTFISEGRAIYRFLEEFQPEPPLLGTTALQKSIVEMWDQRAEMSLFGNVAMAFQHISGFFKDRMTPIPEWGATCRSNALATIDIFEQHLADNQYLAGDFISTADLTTLATLEFARTIQFKIDDQYPNLKRWQQSMKQRASYRA